MKKTYSFLIWVLFLALMAAVLCMPRKSHAGVPEATTGHGAIPTTQPAATTEPTQPYIVPQFIQNAIDLPESITKADSVYCCYQDEDLFILSTGESNGQDIGQIYRTTAFAVCNSKGIVQFFKVSTDADIMTAFPYKDGILYADYVRNPDETVAWTIVYRVGSETTVLDSGMAKDYDASPYLFAVDGIPCYMWNEGDRFGVKCIREGKPEWVLQREDCQLIHVFAESAASFFCYQVRYPGSDSDTLCLATLAGKGIEQTVPGNLNSYMMTDESLVYVSEAEKRRAIHILDPVDGTEKSVMDSLYAMWQLSGAGTQAIAVGNSWQAYWIDLESGKITLIPGTGKVARYYCMDNGKYLVMTKRAGEYAFSILSVER